MPSKRTTQFATVTLLVAACFVIGLGQDKAEAAKTDPPFVLRFPQETQATQWSSTFGAGRGGGRRHQGNDLMASKMTEVYAIADGFVERMADSRSAGRYLTINHGNGWSSNYMHLNNDDPGTDNGRADWNLTVGPGVEEGAPVFAGQLIGFVGDSGNAEWTGPHTHFELRINGRAINPYNLLLESWQAEVQRQRWEPWQLVPQIGLDAIG